MIEAEDREKFCLHGNLHGCDTSIKVRDEGLSARCVSSTSLTERFTSHLRLSTMPARPWADSPRLTYLRSKIRSYEDAQEAKSTRRFLSNVHVEYFSKFPQPVEKLQALERKVKSFFLMSIIVCSKAVYSESTHGLTTIVGGGALEPLASSGAAPSRAFVRSCAEGLQSVVVKSSSLSKLTWRSIGGLSLSPSY